MGNNQSNVRAYHKLNSVYPPVEGHGFGSQTNWFDKDKSARPYTDNQDRDQFIYATITVLSQNGSIDLNQHDFRLLFSRRENDRLVARVVAEREGIIKAQIEPRDDGKDQGEAFKALRRHVEMTLDRILADVPGASPSSGDRKSNQEGGIAPGPSKSSTRDVPSSPSTSNAPTTSGSLQSPQNPNRSRNDPVEAPPAYGSAVKEWRSTGEEKKG